VDELRHRLAHLWLEPREALERALRLDRGVAVDRRAAQHWALPALTLVRGDVRVDRFAELAVPQLGAPDERGSACENEQREQDELTDGPSPDAA
jgi:hypothetical protein